MKIEKEKKENKWLKNPGWAADKKICFMKIRVDEFF